MLFQNIQQLKEYCQVGGTPDFAAFTASLRMVENTYVIPIIGMQLYKDLDTAIKVATTADPLPDTYVDLLHQCRMAIGPLFCFTHADKADVLFTDTGMKRIETATNKSAYQEQRTKFKEANLAEGEAALEMLIQFLEENMDNYAQWTDSENFKRYRSLFIKTGAEFNQFFPSATPYRNYWSMRTKMLDVEENDIREFLGDALFDDLKEADGLKEPGFSDPENKLLFKIKKAIANFTVAFAAPLLNVRLGGNGITVPAASSFSTNDNDNIRGGIPDNAMNVFVASCNSTAIDWIENAKKFLGANKNEFPNWTGFTTVDDADDDDDDFTLTDRPGGAYGMT